MSNLATNAQSNMKQVMRTALVGVSPADQLMLKGYLRVLLRLEADLEWVPANHPQVDLLFINDDFRSSPSVKKLLASTSSKPVMFVKRDPNGGGRISKDLLILPLTQLTLLNDWLMQNVSVLSSVKPTHEQRQRIDKSNETPVNKTTAEPSSRHSNQNAQAQQSKTADRVSNSQVSSTKAASSSNSFEQLIALTKLVSERPVGVFELAVNGKRVGIASLKRQRLWLTEEVGDFDSTWQLKKVTQSEPTTESVDLFQWLWNKAWQSPKPLVPLVSENYLFHLRYWPKPLGKKDRSELLKIFTALEGEPRNIKDIAELAETSVNTVKKALAGLLLSGALQPDTYEKLTSPLTSSAVSQNTQPKIGAKSSAPKPVSTGSALDDVLARRASGQSAAPIPSSIELDNDKPVAAKAERSEANSKKRGFLSKLRNKLGL